MDWLKESIVKVLLHSGNDFEISTLEITLGRAVQSIDKQNRNTPFNTVNVFLQVHILFFNKKKSETLNGSSKLSVSYCFLNPAEREALVASINKLHNYTNIANVLL